MSDTSDGEEMLVEWHEWGAAAFEAARAADQPVLLSLSAPWCTWCSRMDRESFAQPMLAANINDSFVPVRVDADRHPRVRERYQMGGFPSTVFCTPDGRVITGATYMSPESLRSAIDAVREAYETRGTDAGRVPRALQDPEPPRGDLGPHVVAHMNGQLEVAFDAEYGGWGSAAKFPLPRTVEYAAKRDRERATRTLDAVYTHLYDTYDGGFYRYAGERDWSDPHREKLLDENAALVRAFATAYLYTGEERFRTPAEGTIDYLTTDLWTGDAFAASQAGDDDYFTMEASDREHAAPPHVDTTVLADRNGLAVDALLRFHAYTDHPGARRAAERALDHVLDTLVEGDGSARGAVRHHTDADEIGVLLDQARVLTGLTTAAGVLGREYLEPARAVADWTIEHRREEDTFLDGPREGAGLLDRPLRPLDVTTELADALVDLAVVTGEERYRTVAHDALAAFAGATDRMGVEVAGYATAAARVVDPPMTVVVDAPVGSDLHRAAWRIADHEKVIRVVAESDDERAWLADDRETTASNPDELLGLVAGGR